MSGTSLLIYGGFTVIFNLFSVFMTYDFMRRFIGHRRYEPHHFQSHTGLSHDP